MYWPNLRSVTLAVPEIIAICSFGLGLRTPNLGEEEAVGGWVWSLERAMVSSYRAFNSNFSSIFSCLRDIAAILLQHAHSTSSLPQISPFFPGNRWMAFGLPGEEVLG